MPTIDPEKLKLKSQRREERRKQRRREDPAYREYERQKQAAYRQRNPRTPEQRAAATAWMKNYYKQKPESRKASLASSRRRRRQLMFEFIQAYGGCCACCGEANPGLLTIDHLEEFKKPRSRTTADSGIYLIRKLKASNWPQETIRCLCFNCNCGRARNGGICPHIKPWEIPPKPDRLAIDPQQESLIALEPYESCRH